MWENVTYVTPSLIGWDHSHVIWYSDQQQCGQTLSQSPWPMAAQLSWRKLHCHWLIGLRQRQIAIVIQNRACVGFAPSQWETSLQSNAVSHWLGANLESAMQDPGLGLPGRTGLFQFLLTITGCGCGTGRSWFGYSRGSRPQLVRNSEVNTKIARICNETGWIVLTLLHLFVDCAKLFKLDGRSEMLTNSDKFELLECTNQFPTATSLNITLLLSIRLSGCWSLRLGLPADGWAWVPSLCQCCGPVLPRQASSKV